MKILGVIILFILLILECFSIYYNKSEWPFHSLNMFVDLKTVSAFKTRIVIVTYEGTEIPAENKHIAPFGPWRMKIVSMKKANEGSSSLDNFLNSFYKIKIRNSDEAYKDIAGIRVYKCTVQNDCLLMGKSD